MGLAPDVSEHHIPVVTALVPGLPAAGCGRIAVGDSLVAVDWEPTRGHSLACLHDLIVGEAGTPVLLRLRHPPVDYDVTLVLAAAAHPHGDASAHGPAAPAQVQADGACARGRACCRRRV